MESAIHSESGLLSYVIHSKNGGDCLNKGNGTFLYYKVLLIKDVVVDSDQ